MSKKTKTHTPIAVVGVSAMFPGSTNGTGFWRDILAGKDLLTDVPETLFNDSEVDAVVICSSTDTHAELITKAAQAGKHIFCEKPLALSVEDIDAALAEVDKAGVALQVGFNRRFDRDFSAIRKQIWVAPLAAPRRFASPAEIQGRRPSIMSAAQAACFWI